MTRRQVLACSILYVAACTADVDAPSSAGGKADGYGEERPFTPHYCGMNSERSNPIFDVCFDFGPEPAGDTPEFVRVGRTGPDGVSHEVYQVAYAEPYDEWSDVDNKLYLSSSHTEDTESWLVFDHHPDGVFEGLGILPTGETIRAVTAPVIEDSPLYVCHLEPRAGAFGGTQDPGQNRAYVVLPEAYRPLLWASAPVEAFGYTYSFGMRQLEQDDFEVKVFAPMEIASFQCEYGSSCETPIYLDRASAPEPLHAFDFRCAMH